MSSLLERRRYGLFLSAITVLCALFLGALLFQTLHTHSIEAAQARLDQWTPRLAWIRWSLMGLAVVFWNPGCRWLRGQGRLSETGLVALRTLRWRCCAWLILLELLLAQNLLGRVFWLALGPSA